MPKCRGSITVFSLLSLLLVTATLLALLEATRYQEIRRFALLQTELALESVFSNYHQDLWQQYRLLGMCQNDAEEILLQTADAKADGNGANLLRFGVESAVISNKKLLTDGEGTVFVKSVSRYMKDNILYEVAKGIYNRYESIQQLLSTSGMDLDKIEEALTELDKLEKAEGNSKGLSGRNSKTNILKMAQGWAEDLTLGLFIEDTSKLSSQKVDLKNDIFHRQLAIGDAVYEEDTNWLDRILLQQYLLTYFSNYETNIAGHALAYEAEYLIGNAPSDKENLMLVISRIIAIREAANFMFLLSDPVKVQQAEALALTIGGASLNPLILEIIHIAVLTAWALAESVLDVRGLMIGKRIPLIKSNDTWRLKLEDISLVSEKFITAKESKDGLTYKDYLGVLLLFEDEQTLAMRAMNVEELTIQKITKDTAFSIDSLVIQAEAEINYKYSPVFPFLHVIGAEERWRYEVRTKRKFGYYEGAV